MNITIPKQFQIIMTISLGVFILFYGIWSMKDVIFGASLSVRGINDGQYLNLDVIKVEGSSHKAQKVTINGREISIDTEGNFNEMIAFLPGYNVTTIESEDSFGKKQTKVFKSYYEPAPPSFAQKETSNPN